MLYEEYLNGIVYKMGGSKEVVRKLGDLYEVSEGVSIDNIVDVVNEMKTIWNFIEPSIRKKTHKRAIGIMRNTYTGFDTEFENINTKYNNLLSVQVAVCSELTVRVPIYTPFELHSVDTLSGEKYEKPLKYKAIREPVINNLIDERVKCIRHTKLGNNDIFMTYLTNLLDTLSFNGVIRKVGKVCKEYNYYIFDKSNIRK